jgi:hypothetical protein
MATKFFFNKDFVVYCYIREPKKPEKDLFWDEPGHKWVLCVYTRRGDLIEIEKDTEQECIDSALSLGLIPIVKTAE